MAANSALVYVIGSIGAIWTTNYPKVKQFLDVVFRPVAGCRLGGYP